MNTTPPPPPGQQPHLTWEDPQPGRDQHPMHQGWGSGHPSAPPVPPQPEAPKRSWFRRHKILTALLAIVALIVVVNLAGGGEEETPAASEEPAAAEEAPADGAAEEPAAPEPASGQAAAEDEAEPVDEEAPAQEPAPEQVSEDPVEEEAPAADSPGLGDAVRDGNFEFTVNEVQTGLTTIGEGFTQESPQGQFVLVDVTVTNIGDKGTALFDNNQLLIDDQGRQHETSSSSIWLDEAISLDDINPGNSVSGVLLYDIPADAVPTSVELHDSMFSGGVTVALQ
ncbi:DUF4352 domain-containing protein [Ornithinimicrobium murale]|uniref:DUF4352 domain-containing protein n=1 Tax=Ornithinimicrobium murale TaxID=1050153 RepID=UPI001EE10140|nr:DUF4352 domain-containing protein [Ornithinimicrobium murale]